jgi:hypothetical protein
MKRAMSWDEVRNVEIESNSRYKKCKELAYKAY